MTEVNEISTAAAEGGIYMDMLATVVKQTGQSINDNIISCLESSAGHTGSSVPSEMQNVKLLLHSDVKEPAYYHGDGTDKCTTYEWVELMSVYLLKCEYSKGCKAEEFLRQLMGRAHVKISLCNYANINLSDGPGPIFDIMKQHLYDTVYSAMPLADCYSTLLLKGESPFDSCIRLNRAIDVAEDCLKRQGKKLDNPSQKVTVMFVRHCLDPHLQLIFRCKPQQHWMAAEVQERLDEFQRKNKYT